MSRTTARITKHASHFQRIDSTNTTAVDVKRLDSGEQLVTVESWRNTRPHMPYYAHRTIVRDRASAMAWVRQMLPLAIAL